MPILHIRALPQKNPGKIKTALKKTVAAIASVYGCESHQVWVTWEEIKPGCYFEGVVEKIQQPKKTHPPICKIICFEGKSSKEIELVLEMAAKTLSTELGIPRNIFMFYSEVKSGRVIAGNGVVKKKL